MSSGTGRGHFGFIILPPGIEHAIPNSGLADLLFLVITSPGRTKRSRPDAGSLQKQLGAPEVRRARCKRLPKTQLDHQRQMVRPQR